MALVAGWIAALAVAGVPTAPVDLGDCIALAVRHNPRIAEAEAKVDEYRAKLAEVESVYYPKFSALAFLAPMYTVHGSALTPDVERHWKRLGDWGPYTHLEATLAQPLYTFGRAKAGETAAAARARVEEARVREARNNVAAETQRLYQQRLFAMSMLPSLAWGRSTVVEALDKAREWYEAGTGDVTKVDVAKLEFGLAELERLEGIATAGAELATAALKFTMGFPEDAPIEFADDRLVAPAVTEPPALPELLRLAADRRPEWTQLAEGRKATIALADAERLADAPVLFLAGQVSWDWTPQRDDTPNPYHYDPYNDLFGGVALGLKFDGDLAKSRARVEQAKALGAQVEALSAYAASGIPLQVKKAHRDVVTYGRLVAVSERGRKAARQWVTFAAAGFLTGTVPAKDVVEGLVAYLTATHGYYETLLALRLAETDLALATGTIAGE